MQDPEKQLCNIYMASRQSAALAVAVRLDMFDAIEEGADTPDRIATAINLPVRSTRALLAALFALGLIENKDGRVLVQQSLKPYILRSGELSLCEMIELEFDNPLTPQLLHAAAVGGRAMIYGGADTWRAHEDEPSRMKAFAAAMHCSTHVAATHLACASEFATVREVLDVGGGTGALAMALVRRWPQLQGTILDLPTVCEVAKKTIRSAGLTNRIRTVACDFFVEQFPQGADCIVLSQVLHDWDRASGVDLLRKAHRALPKDGLVVIHEKLVNEDRLHPLSTVLIDLDMLVWTEGHQYSALEIEDMLSEAGFEDPISKPTGGHWSAVIARGGAL